MTIKHFGTGTWRIRHNQDWQTIAYMYFEHYSEAASRADDYHARYSNLGIVRLEYWNGEAWI